MKSRTLNLRPGRCLDSVAGMAAVAVVVNPTKFKDVDKAKAELAKEFAAFGVTEFDWILTTAEDTGTGQARKAAADGAELVFSWGGDGTVRSVAHGLLDTGVPLGILPGGTGNLVARNLDLPLNLHGAVAVALGGGSTKIDVNEVDLGDGVQRISLIMCGMGLDAAVIESPEKVKAMLGAGAYAVATVQNLFGPAKPVIVTVDDGLPRRVPARMVLVANFGKVQMGIEFVSNTSATDGELVVLVAKLRNLMEWGSTTRNVLLRRRAHGKHRLQLTGKTVELRTTEPWPRELDGDLVEPGDYMKVTVLPGALTVRVR